MHRRSLLLGAAAAVAAPLARPAIAGNDADPDALCRRSR